VVVVEVLGRGAVDDQGGIECGGNIQVTAVVNLERYGVFCGSLV